MQMFTSTSTSADDTRDSGPTYDCPPFERKNNPPTDETMNASMTPPSPPYDYERVRPQDRDEQMWGLVGNGVME
ncbi:unnamed protein product [Arctogadus glacialis]